MGEALAQKEYLLQVFICGQNLNIEKWVEIWFQKKGEGMSDCLQSEIHSPHFLSYALG